MSNHISTRVTQLPYFDRVLGGPGWRGAKVLDFGDNVGGFLAGSGESYCVYYAVEYVRSLFPGAEVFPPISSDWQHCCGLRNE